PYQGDVAASVDAVRRTLDLRDENDSTGRREAASLVLYLAGRDPRLFEVRGPRVGNASLGYRITILGIIAAILVAAFISVKTQLRDATDGNPIPSTESSIRPAIRWQPDNPQRDNSIPSADPSTQSVLLPFDVKRGGMLIRSNSHIATTLCNDLKRIDPVSYRCVSGGSDENPSEIVAQLHANLVVDVDDAGNAKVTYWGRLDSAKLLQAGLGPVLVSTSETAKIAAPLFVALTHATSEALDRRETVCPAIPRPAQESVQLLAIYLRRFAAECVPDSDERDILRRGAGCLPANTSQPATCYLLKYLYLDRCVNDLTADEVEQLIAALKNAPNTLAREVDEVSIKLARHFAKEPSEQGMRAAATTLLDLNYEQDPCLRVIAAPIATRLMLNGRQDVQHLAALPIQDFDTCSETTLIAQSLNARGAEWAFARSWQNARDDFNEAHLRALDRGIYLANLAEMTMLLNGFGEAYDMLEKHLRPQGTAATSPVTPVKDRNELDTKIRMELLAWKAAREFVRTPKRFPTSRPIDASTVSMHATHLSLLYEQVAEGARVFLNAEPSLDQLFINDVVGKEVLDALRKPRTSDSLKQMAKIAARKNRF
ncbi:MAG TPA: hypothetical protein PK156_36695, partial [Polyangium sp.]|nr:hypothetical protein [Polyangium sp.]